MHLSLQTETGYRLEAVTTRKLEFENDAFAFGDKVVEKWYGTVEQGTNKGILVVVTTGKDGALTGGPDFMKVLPLQNYRLCIASWPPCTFAAAAVMPWPLSQAAQSHQGALLQKSWSEQLVMTPAPASHHRCPSTSNADVL